MTRDFVSALCIFLAFAAMFGAAVYSQRIKRQRAEREALAKAAREAEEAQEFWAQFGPMPQIDIERERWTR